MLSRSLDAEKVLFISPLVTQRKHAAAALLLERSCSIRERTLGPEHPEVAQSLNNRALFLKEQVGSLFSVRLVGLSICMKAVFPFCQRAR